MRTLSVPTAVSPLDGVDYRFETYLKNKKAMLSKHMLGNGLPDYAYYLDFEYRKKLDAIPGLFNTVKKIYSTHVTQCLQRANMSCLAVGPKQFPEVYQIGCDCAKKLGIAVPNIYIDSSEEVLNAYAYAMDDVEPFIVVTSLMLKRMTMGELKAVIGHECGHIQNYHTIYDFIASDLLVAGLGGSQSIGLPQRLLQTLSVGVMLTLNMWSRAAEVTADRAALICCDNVEDAYSVNKKLLYGAVDVSDKIDTQLDISSLKEQMQMTMDNPGRILELERTHPLSIKRIFAEMEFAECELFYEWRPDLKTPGQIMRSKEETDARCKKYIDVIHGKGGKL